MSEISVVGNAVVGTVQTTAQVAPAAPAASTEVAAPIMESGSGVTTDSVEFSEQAQWLEKLHDLPSVRQDRIDAIKIEVATDAYLSTDKIHVAIDRMIDEITE